MIQAPHEATDTHPYKTSQHTRHSNKTPRVNDKYVFKSCSDKTVPFGYENSDLKNMYLSSQDLASRLAAPILTQSDYLAKGIQNYN